MELICGYCHLDGLTSASLRKQLSKNGLKATFYNKGNSYRTVLPFENILVIRGFEGGLTSLDTIFEDLEESGCYAFCLKLDNGLIPLSQRSLFFSIKTTNVLPMVSLNVWNFVFYGKSILFFLQVLNQIKLYNKN